jgi:hypothetical protein
MARPFAQMLDKENCCFYSIKHCYPVVVLSIFFKTIVVAQYYSALLECSYPSVRKKEKRRRMFLSMIEAFSIFYFLQNSCCALILYKLR